MNSGTVVVVAWLCLLVSVGVQSSQVLAPASLAGKEVESVLYPSGPSTVGFENISIVWYVPAATGAECSASTMNVTATGIQAIIVLNSVSTCYPETVAKAAFAKGFSAMIRMSFYNRVGVSAAQTWATNTAPIPIFEVAARSGAFEPHVTERVTLIPTETKYTRTWVARQTPAFLAIGLAALWKLYVCARSLFRQKQIIFLEKRLSTAHWVLIIELGTSICAILMALDFYGQLHILPIYVWMTNLLTQYLLTFIATFVLAMALVKAESEIRGQNFAENREILLNVAFITFVLMNVVCILCIGFQLYFNDTLTYVALGSYFFFQITMGSYFVIEKRRILQALLIHRQLGKNDHAKKAEFQRMTYCLKIAAVFMFSYSFLFIVIGISVSIGSYEMCVAAELLQGIANVTTGLAQVLSLPQQITGVNFSLRSSNFSANGKGSSNKVAVEVADRTVSTAEEPASPTNNPTQKV